MRDRMREHAFVTAFIVGLTAIVLTKIFLSDYPIAGGFLASVLAIFVMFVYRRNQTRVRHDDLSRIGDEIYYLGLLYTLVSLSIALLLLFIVPAWTETPVGTDLSITERTNEMVGSFGIALLTTIAGIVMRMTLQTRTASREGVTIHIPSQQTNQSEQGDASQSDGNSSRFVSETNVTVAQFVLDLQHQLQLATNSLTMFLGHVASVQQTFSNDLELRTSTFHDALEEGAKTHLEQLEVLYKTSFETQAEMAEQTEATQNKVAELLGKLESTLQGVGPVVEQLEQSSSDIVQTISSAANESKTSAEQLNQQGSELVATWQSFADSMVSSLSNVQQFQEQIGVSFEKVQAAQAEIDNLGQQAKKTDAELASLSSSIGSLNEVIGALQNRASSSRESLEGNSSDLDQHSAALRDQIAVMTELNKHHEDALQKTVSQLHGIVEAATNEVKVKTELTRSLAATNQEITRFNEGVAAKWNELNEEQQELINEVKSTKEAIKTRRTWRKRFQDWFSSS